MKPDMTFEYFNPKFEEMFGYTLKDLSHKEAHAVKGAGVNLGAELEESSRCGR